MSNVYAKLVDGHITFVIAESDNKINKEINVKIKDFDSLLDIVVIDERMVQTDNDLTNFVVEVMSLARRTNVEFNLIKTVCKYFSNENKELIIRVITDGNYRKNMYGFIEDMQIIAQQTESNFIFNVDELLNIYKNTFDFGNYIEDFFKLLNADLTYYQQEQLFYSACKLYCEKSCNVEPCYFADTMFSIAYDQGHSGGASDIYSNYCNLVDLYNIYAELKGSI